MTKITKNVHFASEKDYKEKYKTGSGVTGAIRNTKNYEIVIAAKKACIDSYFGTPLEEQEIDEKIKSTDAFKKAYEYTTILLNKGTVPEDVREYYSQKENAPKHR